VFADDDDVLRGGAPIDLCPQGRKDASSKNLVDHVMRDGPKQGGDLVRQRRQLVMSYFYDDDQVP
jgi:hypothetical protein